MQQKHKRLLAALLVITMCLSMVPGSIFANLVNAQNETATLKAQIVRTEIEATADEATRDEATNDEATSDEATDDGSESTEPQVTETKRVSAKKAAKKVKTQKNVATPDEPVATPDEPVATPDQPGKPGTDEKDDPEYIYELFLWVDDTRVVNSLSVTWKYGNKTVQDDGSLKITSKSEDVTAVVEYDGIILTVNSSADNSEVVTFGPKDAEWVSEEGIIVGTEFGLPSSELKDGQSLKNNGATADEATRDMATREVATADEATGDEATSDEAYREEIVEGQFETVISTKGCKLYAVDNGYYAAGAGTVNVTQIWKGTSGIVYAKRTFDRTVRYPVARFYLDGTAVTESPAEWFNKQKTVKVIIERLTDLVSTEYLPEVLVNGEKATGNWELNGNVYEMAVPVSTSSTITYGKDLSVETSLTLKVDVELPTVKFLHSYFNATADEATRDEAIQVIKFETTVGESGYKSITITDKNDPENPMNVDPSLVKNGVCELILESGYMDPAMITVINNAGKEFTTLMGEDGKWYPAQPDLTISFNTDAVTLGESCYLPKDNEMTVVATIAGVTQDGDYNITSQKIVALDQAEAEITYKVNDFENGREIVVPLETGLSKLTVSVTDEMGRTQESCFETKYRVDLNAPEIKTDLNLDKDVYISEAEAQFKLWIVEEELPEDYVNGSSYVKYTVNNKVFEETFNEDGEYVIKLENGDVLSAVEAVAYDLTGNASETYEYSKKVVVDNTDPTIELSLSDNVVGLFQNANESFAVIPEEDDTVTVFAKVTDTPLENGENNLDLDKIAYFMGPDQNKWDYMGNQCWSKTLKVADNETGVETFTFKAVDLAGNECTDVLLLTFGEEVEDGMAQNVLPISYNQGSYSFNLNLDRRAPSSIDSGDLSITINEDMVEGTDIYNTDKLTVTITDKSEGGKDSGIANVTAEVDNELINVTVGAVDNNDKCVIEMDVPADLEAHAVNLEVTTQDYAGNQWNYVKSFNVDTKAPEIHVTKELVDGAEYVRTDNGVDYYNGKVEYIVSIEDMYLNAEDGDATLKIVYQDETIEVYRFEDAAYPYTRFNPHDQYVYSFVVEDEKLVKEIVLEVEDNAGNRCNSDASNLNVDDEQGLTSFRYENGLWIYNGNQIAVDMTAPDIVVTKKPAVDVDGVPVYNNVDYYNCEVTYQFVVTDMFLTADAGEAQLVVDYQGDRVETVDLLLKSYAQTEDYKDQYTYAYTVVNGEMVEGMTLVVRDNADNMVNGDESNLTVDKPEERTSFAYNEGQWDYTGNPVVVDTKAPDVKVEFSPNVTNYYRYGNTIYVICAPAINGESGVPAGGTAEKVTVTITAQDANLALDNGVVSNPEYGFVWTGTPTVNNPDNVVTFVADSSVVNPDGTKTFVIDVGITDLAGNKITSFDQPDYGNGRTLPDVDKDGYIKFVTSVDRRRPTSQDLNDTSAPTIEVTPSVAPNTTAADRGSLDLFSGDFSFNVSINDGVLNERNSGVYSVQWSVTDVNGAVVNNTVDVPNDNRLETLNISIPVTAVTGRESNEVKLNIVATDYVGNTVTFEKVFAVDTLAPRVTITQSNHEVSHDKYFKAQQVVTIRIEDLNFEPTTSTVNTQVNFNGWRNVGGNVYETVLTYNRDGDYTFAMASTDRANNSATIDYTTGLTALQDFVVDMTAPVIDVHYTDSGLKNIFENVEYYDAKRTLSLTITEHNFAANEVTADVLMNGAKKDTLNATGNRGDVHNYGYTFEDGNKYSVLVSYTDMAGNRAILRGTGTADYSSPRFTVDSKKPEIVMTKGDLNYGELNVIDGELNLGFTITDAEGNMSENVTVQLQFQDRNFGQTTIEKYYTVSRANNSTVYVDFSDIPAELDTDGIYTLRISATDHSGNLDELDGSLVMSVNRYGSTFTTDDPSTRQFLVVGPNEVIYRQSMDHDLIIKEINPNLVYQDSGKTAEGSLITVSANGKSVTLTAGADYDLQCIKHEQGSGCWYEYVYTIYKGVFHDGEELVNADYTISFYSEDAAGHKNANDLNEGSALTQEADGTYSGRLSFTLDNQPPVVTITGAVDNKQYRQENISIRIDLADNTPTDIKIYVGDELITMLEAGASAPTNTNWFAWDQNEGCYKLNLAEARGYQNVRVVVTDEAGNETPQTLRIQVSSSFFDLYIHNTWALVGTAVGLAALIAVVVLLLSKKKKKAANAG